MEEESHGIYRKIIYCFFLSFSNPLSSSHHGISSLHNLWNLSSTIGLTPSKCSSPSSGGLLTRWSMNLKTPFGCSHTNKKNNNNKKIFKVSYENARNNKDKTYTHLKEKTEILCMVLEMKRKSSRDTRKVKVETA